MTFIKSHERCKIKIKTEYEKKKKKEKEKTTIKISKKITIITILRLERYVYF